MLEMKSDTILALESGIVLHSLPDQDWFYAFSVTTGDQFRLNRTSFWVLEEISSGIEWIRLRDHFLATFEVSTRQGETDLQNLVNEMYGQKIVRRQDNEEKAI